MNYSAGARMACLRWQLSLIEETRDYLELIKAGITNAAKRFITLQLNFRRKIIFLYGFVPKKIGAEVLLVVVGKDGGNYSIRSQHVLHDQGADEICA